MIYQKENLGGLVNMNIRYIEYGTKMYKVVREIKKHNFPELKYAKEFRDIIGADKVLQTNTSYLFCENIDDALIIENGENVQ
jgi:hypothetical protein